MSVLSIKHNPISLRSILILSTHIYLYLTSIPFPSFCHLDPILIFLRSYSAACLVHLILPDLIILITLHEKFCLFTRCTLVSCTADFRTLKMEVIPSSETSVYTQTARRYIPEDGNIGNYHCENLIFYIIFPFSACSDCVLEPSLPPV
jgi:hypothetical protein